MRMLFAATTVLFTFGLIAPSNANLLPCNATAAKASPANASIIVAKECRCVEYRFNGSCKRRECRDNW
jgi:hypothetical protein